MAQPALFLLIEFNKGDMPLSRVMHVHDPLGPVEAARHRRYDAPQPLLNLAREVVGGADEDIAPVR